MWSSDNFWTKLQMSVEFCKCKNKKNSGPKDSTSNGAMPSEK